MTSVQDDTITLYMRQLSNAALWYEERLDTEDGVITLTAVNETHQSHDFIESVLVQMLGAKLIAVNTEPHTKRRYWRIAK